MYRLINVPVWMDGTGATAVEPQAESTRSQYRTNVIGSVAPCARSGWQSRVVNNEPCGRDGQERVRIPHSGPVARDADVEDGSECAGPSPNAGRRENPNRGPA